jgi:hypothetical protein
MRWIGVCKKWGSPCSQHEIGKRLKVDFGELAAKKLTQHEEKTSFE